MLNLTVDIFDPQSVDKAIKELRQERRKLNAKTKEFIQRLADIGLVTASAYYAEATYAGKKDVKCSVTYKNSARTYVAKIKAHGNAVLFIEFGTGIFKPDAYEARDELSPGSAPMHLHGMYGDRKGANPKGWFYYGTPQPSDPSDTFKSKYSKRKSLMKTFGNEAMPAMYMARREIIDKVQEIAKEVFGND